MSTSVTMRVEPLRAGEETVGVEPGHRIVPSCAVDLAVGGQPAPASPMERLGSRRAMTSFEDPPPPEPGDRLLLPCDGGPSQSRLVHFPPPVEITERDGLYVLVDEGAPHEWRYQFVSNAD